VTGVNAGCQCQEDEGSYYHHVYSTPVLVRIQFQSLSRIVVNISTVGAAQSDQKTYTWDVYCTRICDGMQLMQVLHCRPLISGSKQRVLLIKAGCISASSSQRDTNGIATS
jgi:hypothetical protein